MDINQLKKNIKNKLIGSAFFAQLYNYLRPGNRFRIGKKNENSLQHRNALLDHTAIEVYGQNNRIVICPGTKLRHCHVIIYGNHNLIHVGENGLFLETEFFIEDDDNEITVGPNARFCGKTQLAAIEGTKITSGPDSLFSSNIQFRTGDSHSIVSMESGRRINLSADIEIGEHVWIGSNVICLKGGCVPDHCLVGAGSVVTKKFCTPHCAIGGVPAGVIKEKIDWLYERIEGKETVRDGSV